MMELLRLLSLLLFARACRAQTFAPTQLNVSGLADTTGLNVSGLVNTTASSDQQDFIDSLASGLKPNDVIMIEFMAEDSISAINYTAQFESVKANENKMMYTVSAPMNLGKPSPEASLCLWLYLKNRRYNDYVLDLTAKEGNQFNMVNLGIFSSQLYIQHMKCTLYYPFNVPLRQWIHICLAMGDRIVTYIDGKVMAPNQDCSFGGTTLLTSSNSQLVLGGNKMVLKPLCGKIADARLYLEKLGLNKVQEVRSFVNTTGEYISMIKMPSSTSLVPASAAITAFDKADLTANQSASMWFQVTKTLPYYKAASVCKRFGGTLLDTSTVDNSALLAYARNVLSESLSNFWVMSPNNSCLSMSISPAGISFESSSECNRSRRTLCSALRSKIYYLIGGAQYADVNRLPLKMIENKLTWDAEYDLRLEYSESDMTFYIMNSISKEIYVKNSLLAMDNLMGRKQWLMTDASPPFSLSLTLTACSEGEFTCTNGQCVDLWQICNFNADCEDFTDEQLCNYTQNRPSYYDNQLSGQKTLEVDLKVALLRILELDMNEGTVKVNLQATAYWRDERVVFHNIYKCNETLVPQKDASFYWQPDIQLDGVVNEDVSALSMDTAPDQMYIIAQELGNASTFQGNEVIEHAGKDVLIKHQKSAIMTLMCPMDLYIYPFDIQTCRFNLSLQGKINSDDVQWSLSKDEQLEYTGSPLQLFQFIYFKKKSNQDNQHAMMFELRIARRYGSDILVTFLPCFVMELIGLSVFAIPLENLSDRLTVSISCLIVMAALLTQIGSTLPVSADPKMIDSWMFIHVLIMAVAFFCMVLLEVVNQKLGPDKEEGDRWLKKVKIHPYKDEDEETEEDQNFTFPTKLNKYLAIFSLLSYFTFVVVFIGYIFGVRNSVLGTN